MRARERRCEDCNVVFSFLVCSFELSLKILQRPRIERANSISLSFCNVIFLSPPYLHTDQMAHLEKAFAKNNSKLYKAVSINYLEVNRPFSEIAFSNYYGHLEL